MNALTPGGGCPAPDASGPRISAERVSFVRAGRTILDSVTLDITAGESVALVGPSGSGKSSLLALLAELECPDGGTVETWPNAVPTGLILQGYALVSVLTAAENVEAALQVSSERLSRRQVRERAAAALDAVGLLPVAGHLVEELSGGQQQRVAIARALVVEPRILLADELTAELDHQWKDRVVELVLGVAGRGGLTVLATHDPDIARHCTRVVRITDGRLESADEPVAPRATC